MNPSPALPDRAPHGSILVAALIALVILLLVVASIVVAGGRESDQSRNRWAEPRAFYNAESAVAMSLRELASNNDDDGDGTIGGVSDDGNSANNPALNGGTLGASYDSSSGAITTSGAAITATRALNLTVSTTPTAACRPGLYFEAWPLAGDTLVSAFDWGQGPSAIGWVHYVYWPDQAANSMMFVGQTALASRMTGQINAPVDGMYDFELDVDDDARLSIDGEAIVEAASLGSCRRVSGSKKLTAGWHDLEILYTNANGTSGCLAAYWQQPDAGAMVLIPPSMLRWSPAARLPGVVAASTITFSGALPNPVSVVGWDASKGAYSAALQQPGEGDLASNATSSNTITGYNGATVYGDASVGVGGSAATAIFFNSGASVTGTKGALATALAVPFHKVPPDVPSTSSGALSLWGSNSSTIAANRRYDSIGLSNNSTLNISGDCSVYVTGAVQLSNSARISVGANSVLRLYVGGGVTASNSSSINSSQLPERCYIYMLSGGTTLNANSTAQIHAHVRAPLGAVSFSGSAIFSGTVWANTFQATNNASVRLDCGPLGGSGGVSGGGGAGAVTITAFTDP